MKWVFNGTLGKLCDGHIQRTGSRRDILLSPADGSFCVIICNPLKSEIQFSPHKQDTAYRPRFDVHTAILLVNQILLGSDAFLLGCLSFHLRGSSGAFLLGLSDIEDEAVVFFRNVWTRPVTQRHIPEYMNCYTAYPVHSRKL